MKNTEITGQDGELSLMQSKSEHSAAERSESMKELERERDYYKTRLEELGASYLHCQDQLSLLRKECDRKEAAAHMIAESARLMIFASGTDDVAREFLTTIVKTTSADRAMVLQCRPDPQSGFNCSMYNCLGYLHKGPSKYHYPDSSIPSFAFVNSDQETDAFTAFLQNILGVKNLVWVFSRNSGWALLLGNDREDVRYHKPFSSSDHEIFEGALKVFMNIVWRLESEEESLRVRLERFSNITEMSGEIIWESDAKGVYTYISRAVEPILGYEPGEIIDQMCFADFLHSEEKEEYFRHFFEFANSGDPVKDKLVQVEHRDGRGVWLMVNAQPVLDDNGQKTIGFRGSYRDLTVQKALEEERHALEEQYYKEQRMGSIGRLAGGLAHDMNNLLTPVVGYSELMLEELAPEDERREFLKSIAKAGHQAQNLIAQLMAFGRKQVLSMKSLKLEHMLDDFMGMLRSLIRDDINLHLDVEDNLPGVYGDSSQIELAIINMAINAQEAMPGGGDIHLGLHASDLLNNEPEAFMDLPFVEGDKQITPGKYVVLSILDNGHGIVESHYQQLFEPFFTTREEGNGLGLPSILGIVKQHKGYIRIYSALGAGTALLLFFPVEHSISGDCESEILPANVDKKLCQRATVVVVDDNEMVRKLAEGLLRRRGFEVYSAMSGNEALRIVDELAKNVDILITDVIMPEMSGRVLGEQIKVRYPSVEVIYMSGYHHEAIVNQGIIEAGTAFLQKPFTPDKLMEILTDMSFCKSEKVSE